MHQYPMAIYNPTKGLQVELDPESSTESGNGLFNIILAGGGEGSTEEHLLLLDVTVRLEPASARDKDAVVDGSVEDVLFDIVA